VSEYRTKRLKTGVKNATVNREVALLRHMFRMAIEWGLCAKNPARGIQQLHEQRRDRFLSKEEICRLLQASALNISRAPGAAYHDARTLDAVVETALHTGMRKGELLPLEWETNVSLEQRSVFLPRTKNHDPRRIPIDSELLDKLLEHRRRGSLLFGKALQEAESKLTTALQAKADKSKIASLRSSAERAHKWKSGAEKFVFPSYDRDGNVVPLKDVKNGFGRLLRDAGIKGFRFHDLRHTFASQYMMGGGNLYTLAKLLGHRDIKMTQRYADLAPDYIDAERDRLDTIWTLVRESQQKGESASSPKYVQ
jgi:site-specific recombinase XerD